VSTRDIEQLLAARGLADPPTAARLARLAGGRSGLALTYAGAPGAAAIRGEIARTLLDLLDRGPAARMVAARDLMARATALMTLLAPAASEVTETPRKRQGRPAGGGSGDPAPAKPPNMEDQPQPDATEAGPGIGRKVSAADRRRALGIVLDAWLELARDLALAMRGVVGSIRDMTLLDELVAMAPRTESGDIEAALARLERARELLDANVSPELLLDVTLLRWPRARPAA
jgi:hypothetical protein